MSLPPEKSLLRRRALAVALIVVALAGCGTSDDEASLPARLTLDGMAGVSADATPASIRDAWELPLEVVELVSENVSVGMASVCAGEQRGLLLFVGGRLEEMRFDSGTLTDRGVGNGSTRAQLRAAYGDRLRRLPEPYANSLRLTGTGGRGTIDFDLDRNGRVSRVRYGLRERHDPWIVEYVDLRVQCPE
ncbi:MAG: hypothetical protein H0V68_03495 [Actinobacteria bacterium]|nr:hypothetical protein [Actinomycetota bacterium]